MVWDVKIQQIFYNRKTFICSLCYEGTPNLVSNYLRENPLPPPPPPPNYIEFY